MINKKLIELPVIKTNRSISSLRQAVIRSLREREIYRKDLVYRGFNKKCINNVLLYGSENSSERYIYANSEECLNVDPDPAWINSLTYAKAYGALAVYRTDKLKEICFTCYEFLDLNKKLEALVAIFSFNI